MTRVFVIARHFVLRVSQPSRRRPPTREIRGLAVGKWIQNVGGVGAFASVALVLAAAVAVWFRGAGAQALAVASVIQLIPFIYLFLALTKTSGVSAGARAAGVIGLMTTVIGLAAAFLPTADVTSVTVFEAKMAIGVVGPIAIGWILYARSRAAG